MAFICEAGRIDGSWVLTIYVTDLQEECSLRVKGDLHIGGLMLNLVQYLDVAHDWSDHALWWPEKNRWLLRPRYTLDQLGVQADAKLQFTPMHKTIRIQLPDLQVHSKRVDFSAKCFSAVVLLCRDLGIRHPEELSLMRKWDRDDLKRLANEVTRYKRKKDAGDAPPGPGPLSPNGNAHSSSSSVNGKFSPHSNRSPVGPSPTSTLMHTPAASMSISGYNSFNGTMSPGSVHSLSFESSVEACLVQSPPVPSKEAFQFLCRPRNFSEKARINCAWLDSSCSLMEQGVVENDFVMLKFKFYNFYDLNVKYDAIRLNQIYEQAKWALISEQVGCTEQEMTVFAALQLQTQMKSGLPLTDQVDGVKMANHAEHDEVDAALTELQSSLEGSSISAQGDITHIPELSDYVRFLRPKKLTLKSYKRYWATFRDTHITFFRSREDASGEPIMRVNVRGCESQPDVNLAAKKFGVRLFVPEADGMSEILLRFEQMRVALRRKDGNVDVVVLTPEDQYLHWAAAFKLASKGRTMADCSYQSEVTALKTFLLMQHPNPASVTPHSQVHIHPEDFMSAKCFRKIKSKTIAQKIMEAHANVRDMSLTEAKMAYIKAWQSLPEYGITYFRIHFADSKKEELLGVAIDRVIRIDLSSGDVLKTWFYNLLQTWHVNWENESVILNFEDGKVVFSPLECSCKTVHEFIGGYIFLSTRSRDRNQTLNEDLFHKLTGGWS